MPLKEGRETVIDHPLLPAPADADVVCLQEVSPVSFEDDFAFMQELGYDGSEMFKKGRFRPATFWKSSKVELASKPVHKDRTMLTAFRLTNTAEIDSRHWYVLNCHLQAGFQSQRRLRQIHEGVRAAMTLARKLHEEKPEESIRLVVCGDFNGGPECAAVRYLEDGAVDSDFLEDGEPATSSKKQLPLSSPMHDVAAAVSDREPPSTLVAQELISVLVEEGTVDNPRLSREVVERLTRIFNRFASQTDPETSEKGMDVNGVEKWLIIINRELGRGSEFREAARQMGWTDPDPNVPYDDPTKTKITLPPEEILSLEGFLNVYEKELRGGKFWGIAYDLAVLGEPLPDAGTFTARYDRMYCSASLQPTAVLDTLCDRPCPNDVEPSDHLPVTASFALR